MAWLFSKRCGQALEEKKIKVSIPLTVRTRIWRLLQDYNKTWSESTDTGWNYETSSLQELPKRMEAELGITELIAFPQDNGEPISSDMEGFVLRGVYPPYLLDAIELFYENLDKNQNQFQTRFNDIMEESGLPWRMANGKIFPVDSSYIDEEIMRRASALLNEMQFHGALEEFERARSDLSNGYAEGAIQNANLAVESTIKEILGIEKAKPGKLFKDLSTSGFIPEYYTGFLKAFEENILRCVAIIRNEELGVGHGKGPSSSVVPRELAELAVNLAGVLMNYLIKQYVSKTGIKGKDEIYEEDLPF